jgi:methylenetetrahydrofolate dehydrogenase (NADP+)/methenyltetrahydrofolate cyclohydrolase
VATLLDGKLLAARTHERLAPRLEALSRRGVKPGLTVLLVGDDPASQVYVRNKARACEKLGIVSEVRRLPADTSQAELLAQVAGLNADPAVHGILVQLPLPEHVDEAAVTAAISPLKDVDGFHPENLGLLLAGTPRFVPCTPQGVMEFLDAWEVPLTGRHAVVIGRSNIVGKPMALLLLARHCTVTWCHSRTRDLASFVARADVVVAAVGRPRLVRGEWIKEGATVIDVGMNRLPDGTLCGDVDFASAEPRAAFITPVPGGVGLMTVAMLLANTVDAAERGANVRPA